MIWIKGFKCILELLRTESIISKAHKSATYFDAILNKPAINASWSHYYIHFCLNVVLRYTVLKILYLGYPKTAQKR